MEFTFNQLRLSDVAGWESTCFSDSAAVLSSILENVRLFQVRHASPFATVGAGPAFGVGHATCRASLFPSTGMAGTAVCKRACLCPAPSVVLQGCCSATGVLKRPPVSAETHPYASRGVPLRDRLVFNTAPVIGQGPHRQLQHLYSPSSLFVIVAQLVFWPCTIRVLASGAQLAALWDLPCLPCQLQVLGSRQSMHRWNRKHTDIWPGSCMLTPPWSERVHDTTVSGTASAPPVRTPADLAPRQRSRDFARAVRDPRAPPARQTCHTQPRARHDRSHRGGRPSLNASKKRVTAFRPPPTSTSPSTVVTLVSDQTGPATPPPPPRRARTTNGTRVRSG